ncbi:MAG: Rad52/Rad22 family DNA repair protein [Christensenella sp.]|nr:Rad52/Rad22 family DNA repair protein [Christensenella sp.]
MEKNLPKFRLLEADEIEVRVKQVSENGATALLYKTARTDMDILDETVGADHWYSQYAEIKGNLYCGIDIDGICKWNCGVESKQDSDGNEKKGEASDAFKRAGFCWGIGRELYTSPFIFLKTKTEKNQFGKLVVSNYATFSVSSIEYDDKRRISKLSIINDKTGEIVFTFTAGGTKHPIVDPDSDAPEEPEEPKSSTFVNDEAAKLRKLIIDLAAKAGRDESKARMFAEEWIERSTKTFVKWDDMTVGHLASVKVELAKKIAGK